MAFTPTDIVEDMALTQRFDGFSLLEDGGAAAVLVEFFETDTDGQLLMSIALAADEERTMFFDEELVGPVGSGIVHIETTGTGTITSSVIYARIKR